MPMFAITNVDVFDGHHTLSNQAIFVDGDTIQDIIPMDKATLPEKIFDGKGFEGLVFLGQLLSLAVRETIDQRISPPVYQLLPREVSSINMTWKYPWSDSRSGLVGSGSVFITIHRHMPAVSGVNSKELRSCGTFKSTYVPAGLMNTM